MIRQWKLFAWTACLALASGCSTLPVDDGKPVSTAFDAPETTALGRHFDTGADGGSRFRLLVGGLDAFKSRLALVESAERSVDVQAYIWRLDETGRALLQRTLLAADRGVRVRILLDDVNAAADEASWLAADAHANVEVRFFNPLGNRRLRVLDIVDAGRINHRMHNKMLLADGAVAVIGGRNIGDHYFGVNVEANFRDLDLLVAGNAVPELGRGFDGYWNSPWALPVATLAGWKPAPGAADRLRETFTGKLPEIDELPVSAAPDRRHALTVAAGLARDLIPAPATVLLDTPKKVQTGEGKVMRAVEEAIADVDEELLIESAYFVPKKSHTKDLAALAADGVRVVVLTNSLATNDVALAHAGYKNHQEALLDGGIELFELRPDASADRRRWSILASESLASLHTKAFVFDRQKTFIGSLNFDPRSRNLNTESGILVDSRELAESVAAVILNGTRGANSYELLLHDGKVRFRLVNDGEVELLDHDPETSAMKRAVTRLLQLLPVEDQL